MGAVVNGIIADVKIRTAHVEDLPGYTLPYTDKAWNESSTCVGRHNVHSGWWSSCVRHRGIVVLNDVIVMFLLTTEGVTRTR